jgi:hypothetical protein
MISDIAIKSFKKIWLEQFGEELSDEEASVQAARLLELMNVVYRPLQKSWVEGSNSDTVKNS